MVVMPVASNLYFVKVATIFTISKYYTVYCNQAFYSINILRTIWTWVCSQKIVAILTIFLELEYILVFHRLYILDMDINTLCDFRKEDSI